MKLRVTFLILSFAPTLAFALSDLTTEESLTDKSTEPLLDGEWKLVERVCGTGRRAPLQRVAPVVGSSIGQATLRLKIQGSFIEIYGSTEGRHSVQFASIEPSERRIFSLHPPYKDKFIYRLEDDGSLTFLARGKNNCPSDAHGNQDSSAILFINFVRI